MSELEFYLFNFGSYPAVPHVDDTERRSLYIDLPNEFYDPIRGQWYLDSYFDTLIFGEKLGFDGICTTTQMGGPIGMTPSSLLPPPFSRPAQSGFGLSPWARFSTRTCRRCGLLRTSRSWTTCAVGG